jgi:hypothetical protein
MVPKGRFPRDGAGCLHIWPVILPVLKVLGCPPPGHVFGCLAITVNAPLSKRVIGESGIHQGLGFWDYHIFMPDNVIPAVVAYICECGKKWAFTRAEASKDSTVKCRCGRTIIVNHGTIFSTEGR